ncbi:hypothetical protein BH20ACI2_BH20ACI2_01100 [soil metagenome]
MGRKILAVIVGWIVAAVVIMIGQMLMATKWSPTTTNIQNDPAAMRAYVEGLPSEAFIVLIVVYAIASFAGGFIVTKMGRRFSQGMNLALIIATLLFIGGILNFFVFVPYHPLWVSLISLAVYFPFTLLGYKAAS